MMDGSVTIQPSVFSLRCSWRGIVKTYRCVLAGALKKHIVQIVLQIFVQFNGLCNVFICFLSGFQSDASI